jgi:hypothetical protein
MSEIAILQEIENSEWQRIRLGLCQQPKKQDSFTTDFTDEHG